MRRLVLVLLVATVVFGLGVGACSAVSDLGAMTDTGEAFMKAMKAGDRAASFNLLHPDLQKQMGGTNGWAATVTKLQPTEWSFSYKRVEGSQGTMEGTATALGGKPCTMKLTMVKVGSDWKVLGFNFTPK